MKLGFPNYEGDGFLHQFITPPIPTSEKLVKPAKMVRGNINNIDADSVVFSTFELERQARVMRRQHLRDWHLRDWIKGIFGRKDD